VLTRILQRLARFITVGLGPEQIAKIGPYPEGHGLLGELIRHPEPLRTEDLTQHTQSYGFPTNHPPMHSFLGVLIRVRAEVFGNLYTTERRGGAPFDADGGVRAVRRVDPAAYGRARGAGVEGRAYQGRQNAAAVLAATASSGALVTAQPVHGIPPGGISTLASVTRPTRPKGAARSFPQRQGGTSRLAATVRWTTSWSTEQGRISLRVATWTRIRTGVGRVGHSIRYPKRIRVVRRCRRRTVGRPA
jgi:hypothetical protein